MSLGVAGVLGLMLGSSASGVSAKALPTLRSESVVIRFVDTGECVVAKNADRVRPIASVTKLMSALVLKRRHTALPDAVTIDETDKDRLKWSRSRLRVGQTYSGTSLLRAALVASDNRAIYSVVRSSLGERELFVEEMNNMAASLGMSNTRFADPAGIDPHNVSTAHDLLRLIEAVAEEPEIAATTTATAVDLMNQRYTLRFGTTNRLLRSRAWSGSVVLQKTGYTVEAGRSLVLRARILGRTVDMVFLGAREMASVFGDAARVRAWMAQMASATAQSTRPKGPQWPMASMLAGVP